MDAQAWMEIVLVLEDGALIDSGFEMHLPMQRETFSPGFYLALHVKYWRDFDDGVMLGPFGQRPIIDWLSQSAQYLGLTGLSKRELPAVSAMASRVPTPLVIDTSTAGLEISVTA